MPLATGKEMAILKIAATLREIDSTQVARKLVVSPEYAESLIEGLIEDGYLEEKKGVYRITPRGEAVLRPWKISLGPRYIHA